MLTLHKNVINIWSEKGEQWLAQLPSIINSLTDSWSLRDIKPVENMNYNYVASAKQESKTPVVIKISCDEQLILDEYKALKHFAGQGAIQVLDINSQFHALLLEQAIPGRSLKQHPSLDLNKKLAIYAQIVKALASHSSLNDHYVHVSKWCEAIDRITDRSFDKRFIDKAKELKSLLLSSTKHEYLCHGDLHLENILQHGNRWVAIDPKGIIGEMAFEAAAFDLVNDKEMSDSATLLNKLETRIALLSKTLALDYSRLLAWFFLRVMISAQWFIEDNGDPSKMILLARHLYPLCCF